MRIKRKVLQKIVSVFSSVLLLINSFTPYLFLAPILNPVKAEMETVTPTEEPIATPTNETAIPTPTVEVAPTVEVTPVEAITPTEIPTLTPTEAPSVPSPPEDSTVISESPTATPTPEPLMTPKTDGIVETTIVESYSCRADSLNGCLVTDKADYAPTDVAIITGHGFLATTIYTIKVSSTDEPAVNFEKEITTDANGSFTYSYQLDGNYRPNYLVQLTDSFGFVVASVSFTDSRTTSSATLNGSASVTVGPGESITAAVTGVLTGGDDWKGTEWLISTTPPGTMGCFDTGNHNSNATFTESFSITAPTTVGTYNVYFRMNAKDGCNGTQGSLLTLSNAVTVQARDLTAIKSNSLGGGNATSGTPFTWTIRVSNSGPATASFANNDEILKDEMPDTNVNPYTNSNPVTSGTTGTIDCTTTGGGLTHKDLKCKANGIVTMPAGSFFDVTVTVSPTAVGTLTNPRATKICRADSGTNVTESDETNNNCSNTVTVVAADTTAPETTIDSGPSGLVNSNSATFTFSADEPSTFECQLDSGGFSACSSPVTYNDLSEGDHTFDVQATDTAGNPDLTPASQSWTVDTVPPTITDSVTPSSPDGLSDWYVTLPVVSYSCSPDVSCPSDFTFGEGTGLTHTETVTDDAGNSASATSGPFNIDITPPTITGNISPDADVSGWYNILTGAPTITYTCSLDVACPSSYPFGEGVTQSHSETVTDTAGNSAASTISDINVDLTAPMVQSAETQDTGDDGNIDAIKLTFSENINDSMLSLGVADGWDVADPAGSESIETGDTDNDNILLLSFGQGPTSDTGNTPTVTYIASGGPTSTHDTAGNELADYSDTSTDKASPVLLSAETRDSGVANGRIDKIIATFSEDLDGNTVTTGNFDVAGYTINNISVSNNEVTLSVDEKTFNDVGSKPSVSVQTNEDDESVQDPAGNVAVDKTVISLDKSAPLTTITTPTNDSIYNSPINISGSSSDGQGDTVSYTRLFYRTNGGDGEWTEIPSSQRNNESGDPFNWSFNWTPASDGIYDIKAEATDDSDNVENSPTVTNVTYDSTAPAVPTATPGAGDYTSDQSVTLSSSDSLSGVDKIYYTTDGSEPDNSKTEYTGVIMVDKDMTIKAIAYDKAGNTSDILEAVYGIAPVISSEASTFVGTTSTTITWTTDDPSTSRVVYDTVSHTLGTAPNYGYVNSTIEDSTKVTSHAVGITGLTSGTTYYYRTISHGSPETVGAENSFKTDTPNSGGGGGGTVSGVATAPVCNDQKPGNAPVLLSAVAGTNNVTLTWSKASDPVSYYLMTFGTSAGSQTYGNPNIGGKDTTSYTVSGLSGGATYYFKVRAGNGCMPGDFSNELSSAPSGGFVEGIPAGFEAGVLGEATKSGELTGEQTGEPTPTTTVINAGLVKGIATTVKRNVTKYILLLLLILLIIAFYFYYRRRQTA